MCAFNVEQVLKCRMSLYFDLEHIVLFKEIAGSRISFMWCTARKDAFCNEESSALTSRKKKFGFFCLIFELLPMRMLLVFC